MITADLHRLWKPDMWQTADCRNSFLLKKELSWGDNPFKETQQNVVYEKDKSSKCNIYEDSMRFLTKKKEINKQKKKTQINCIDNCWYICTKMQVFLSYMDAIPSSPESTSLCEPRFSEPNYVLLLRADLSNRHMALKKCNTRKIF